MKDKGQALAEFSLIMPILMLIVLAIFDYGRVFLVYANATHALREGTRQSILQGFDGSIPGFANCQQIENQIGNIFFAEVDQIDVHFYQTTLDTYSPEQPDFSCDGVHSPKIGAHNLINGDLMVARLQARVEFITPFLSSIVPELKMNFVSQRTIFKQIVFDDDDGRDTDYDSLDDEWEIFWFGSIRPFNALDDPDGDGCNNACEQARGTNPLDPEDF